MNNCPVQQAVYTLREVFQLEVRDCPSLGFMVSASVTGLPYNARTVIQQSHLTIEQMLSVPGLADTEWRYLRETYEWVPVFMAVDHEAVLACVDLQTHFDLMMCEYEVSVTPKGFPRDPCDHIDYERNWKEGGDGYNIWQRTKLVEPSQQSVY